MLRVEATRGLTAAQRLAMAGDADAAGDAPPLAPSERAAFVHLLRHVTAAREDVQRCMVFVLDHADAAPDLVRVLTEHLVAPEASMGLRIARYGPVLIHSIGSLNVLFVESDKSKSDEESAWFLIAHAHSIRGPGPPTSP